MPFLAPATMISWALAVTGTSSCPGPAAVAARLAALGAPQAQSPSSARAEVHEEPGHISLRLISADGEVLAERALEASASCEDLAAAAAVVVAIWQEELRTGVIPEVRDFARSVPPPHLPPPTPPSRPRFETNLGVTLLGGLAAGRVAPALQLAWFRGAAEGGTGYGAGVWAVGPRTLDLGAGEASWSRVGGHLAAGWQTRPRVWRFTGTLGVGAWLLRMQGRGQPEDATDHAIDPYALAQLTLGVGRAVLEPILNVSAAWHPIGRFLTVEGTGATQELPGTEFFAGVGLRWRLR